MRIKHSPIINSRQNQKKYEALSSQLALQPVQDHHPVPDSNPEVAGSKNNSVQDVTDKNDQVINVTTLPPKNVMDENVIVIDITTNLAGNIQDESRQADNPGIPQENEPARRVEVTPVCNEKPKETADVELVSTKPAPLKANKQKIILPKREVFTVDDKNKKPSASVDPFNYVKFETATGEVLYFSKYFKQPPNLPKAKKNKKKRKRIRTAFTDAHVRRLEEEYSKSRYIKAAERKKLAHSLNLTDRNIKLWFQNRRMKERREINDLESDDEGSVHEIDDDSDSSNEKRVAVGQPFVSQRLISTYYECKSEDSNACEKLKVNSQKRKFEEETDDSEAVSVIEPVNVNSLNIKKEIIDIGGPERSSTSHSSTKRRLISRLVFEDDEIEQL